MSVLSEQDIAAQSATVPEWSRVGETIVRVVEADSFLAGLDLVAAVGRLAEKADHHPDIDIRWRTITFALTTHSAGGLTDLDFDLARAVEELLG